MRMRTISKQFKKIIDKIYNIDEKTGVKNMVFMIFEKTNIFKVFPIIKNVPEICVSLMKAFILLGSYLYLDWKKVYPIEYKKNLQITYMESLKKFNIIFDDIFYCSTQGIIEPCICNRIHKNYAGNCLLPGFDDRNDIILFKDIVIKVDK